VRRAMLAALGALALGCARPPPPPVAIPPFSPSAAAPAPPSCAAPRIRTHAAGCVRFTALALGESHACALSDDGRILCWGSNYDGALGSGSPDRHPAPALVSGIDDAVELHAKARRTCARTRGGEILCWGSNYFGESDADRTLSELPPGRERGVSDETDPDFMIDNLRFAPSRVTLPAPATAFAMGYEHACAILTNGDVACWGRNRKGELGGGPKGGFLEHVFTPPARFVEIAAGALHTCGRSADGTLYCWGDNDHGQLGADAPGNELRRLSEPTGVTASSLAGNRSCARSKNGEFVCFGAGPECGMSEGRHAPEVDQTVGRARALSLGSCHYCALRDGGGVDCWSTFKDPAGASPERLAIAPAERLASGSDASCALLRDGGIVCWGSNYAGEHGSSEGMGKDDNAPSPVDWSGSD
jgi:alpha-tubulin suppressor-like RCC1 family protein